MDLLVTLAGIARPHIMAIAALASLVFGWLLTGRWWWLLPGVVALDWFLVNLMNRVADLAEDRKNGVAGTAWVDANAVALTTGSWILLLGSFPALHAAAPGLTPLRLLLQAIGLAYNYRLLPARREGRWTRTRFKETWLWKNVSSAGLFVLSCQLYPTALGGWDAPVPRLLWLAAFFFPLELTYEILYDLRDVEGDRAEGVPTFPVVHGVPASRRIVEALIAASALALLAGFALGALRFREVVLVAAPVQQAIAVRAWLTGPIAQRDAVRLTWLGAGQIASYCLWVWAGLPLGPDGS